MVTARFQMNVGVAEVAQGNNHAQEHRVVGLLPRERPNRGAAYLLKYACQLRIRHNTAEWIDIVHSCPCQPACLVIGW